MGRNVNPLGGVLKRHQFGRSMFAEIRRVDLASSRPVAIFKQDRSFYLLSPYAWQRILCKIH